MKLQPKRAITADLATDRKAQIDAGVKLATKIDALRENLVVEEGKLSRFRTETIATVQADIDRYIAARDSVKQEIEVLERQRANARIPLDAEWEKFHLVESKFLKDKQAWGEKFYILNERQAQIERLEQEIEQEKGRAEDLNRRAALNLVSADETLKESRESSAEIRNKAQTILVAVEAREREMKLKEAEIEAREKAVEKTKSLQDKKDLEQAGHDKTIKDKYETLARTIKRMGKHG